MFERFTDRARRAVRLAQEEARLFNHRSVGTEHILLGLVHEGQGVAAGTLASLGISLDAVRHQVAEADIPAGSAPGDLPFTPRAKKVLELSLRESQQLGHTFIGTEHILLGLVREGEGEGAQVLVSLGADLGAVRRRVVQLMAGGGAMRSSRPGEETAGPDVLLGGTPVGSSGRTKRGRPVAPWALPLRQCDLCGRDLWEAERFGHFGNERGADAAEVVGGSTIG